jgi:hypothetical protein
MLASISGTPSCGGMHCQADLASRFAETPDRRFWPLARSLLAVCAALRDGLAAQRRYHCLQRRGIPDDVALRHALGISDRGKCVTTK